MGELMEFQFHFSYCFYTLQVIFVRRYVPGIFYILESVETGLLNKAVEFNVNTEAAGGGVLTATGRGPKGEVNVDVRELGNSLYRISFVPVEPGEYIIKLFFNGKEIGGSPLGTVVADPGKAVAHGEGIFQ